MKPYTYTRIVGTKIVSQVVINTPIGIEPAKAPEREYTSVAHQLREETWNLFDATVKQPYGVERAGRNTEVESVMRHNL